jgi:hypothetical protein
LGATNCDIGEFLANDHSIPAIEQAMQYRIKGVDRTTGKPSEPITVAAIDERSALAIAQGQGILPESCEVVRGPAHRTSEPRFSPESKYPALTTLAKCYQSLAIICGAVAAVTALGGLAVVGSENFGSALILVLVCIAWGLVSVITLLAISEGIRLMIDIEDVLRQIRERLPAGPK